VVSKKLSFESYDCLQEDCNWERSSVPHSTFIEDEVIGHQDFWRRKDDLLGEIFEIGNSLSCQSTDPFPRLACSDKRQSMPKKGPIDAYSGVVGHRAEVV